MSIPTDTTKRSRWLDWQPKGRIITDSPEDEPTKPSKVGFAGFDGSIFAKLPIIKLAGAKAPEPNSLVTAGISWAAWKAAALNRLFQEQGVTDQPGRISAATVRHGERHYSPTGD